MVSVLLTIFYKNYFRQYYQITDNSGNLAAEYSYDAWGRMRNPANWNVYSATAQPTPMFGRGYTGHEHLNQFGLINMNARLYDPLLARFLAPDPFVGSGMTNDFNRYVYARNNPLLYTDPSGKFIQWIIAGAIILGKIYNDGVKANHNTNPLKWNWSKATYGLSVGYNGTNGNVTASASIGWNNNYSTNLGYTSGGAGFAFGNTVNGQTHMANPFYSPVDPMQQVVQREQEMRQEDVQNRGWQKSWSDEIMNYAIDPISNGSTALAGIRYTEREFGGGYFRTSSGKLYSLSALELGANGKYIQGVQGLRYGATTAMKSVKWLGRTGNALGVLSTAYNGYNFVNNPNWENGVETAVGVGSYFLWEVGAVYYGGKLFYQGLELQNKMLIREGLYDNSSLRYNPSLGY
jgi:RHS repeat-associated protein